MYVCICNELTEKQIVEAVDSGARGNEVWKYWDVTPQCGQCMWQFMKYIKDD